MGIIMLSSPIISSHSYNIPYSILVAATLTEEYIDTHRHTHTHIYIYIYSTHSLDCYMHDLRPQLKKIHLPSLVQGIEF